MTRCERLLAWYDLIQANREDLATIMTLEQGKPLPDARGEVTYGASFVRWFAEEGASALTGKRFPAIFLMPRWALLKSLLVLPR